MPIIDIHEIALALFCFVVNNDAFKCVVDADVFVNYRTAAYLIEKAFLA